MILNSYTTNVLHHYKLVFLFCNLNALANYDNDSNHQNTHNKKIATWALLLPFTNHILSIQMHQVVKNVIMIWLLNVVNTSLGIYSSLDHSLLNAHILILKQTFKEMPIHYMLCNLSFFIRKHFVYHYTLRLTWCLIPWGLMF